MRLPYTVTPRVIIHGGAGNITRKNLSPDAWENFSANLSRIHYSAYDLLAQGASALDAATHAVTLFEDCPLFNCGKGSVSKIPRVMSSGKPLKRQDLGIHERWYH